MSNPQEIKIIDCPRDAIQGRKNLIRPEKKIAHINNLIKSNLFEYIDFGSFVSPKAVPQMQDTSYVVHGLEKVNNTKLLSIIANLKGAIQAKSFDEIDYLGYPFSISETFQKRNTNTKIEEAYSTVKDILNTIADSDKELVIYISMAFGNPYGDIWNEELVLQWVDKLKDLGIKRFSIADTTSQATPVMITSLFKKLYKEFSKLDFSVHLHSYANEATEKINAANKGGCTRFEGAIMGFGGCPFAQDEMVGNIPTEILLDRFGKSNPIDINKLKISFFDMIS
ncbi:MULTISPECIES: hydroxymethylglutaryl-CoA lyase [Sphingobacterium]|uniref:Hydroxymethylglutaryl-CoA lyase n=1 Tax=Sphingobacterium litopenaei TaxID=2763500 RepID=A0ABR7YCY8_9SPHI|nr:MULTISPECIES: hydroxymethylglutaryl-CoA lyase [Sphingobacterium]MBD1429166.1 hydroxymethylglutaryl-CoA lyase [Sphingobacterium litopenaei]NGM73207.1 hydroxymethylglutaryl-CoA lyase [Sphingobacterium sp. SGL-16]